MLCFGYTLSLIYPRIKLGPGPSPWLSGSAGMALLQGLARAGTALQGRFLEAYYQLALESQILSQHAEILDFYVWALLAAPALMWAWQRINWPLRVAAVLVPWACGSWLAGQDWQPGYLDLTLARWVLVEIGNSTFPLLQWSATVGLGLCRQRAPKIHNTPVLAVVGPAANHLRRGRTGPYSGQPQLRGHPTMEASTHGGLHRTDHGLGPALVGLDGGPPGTGAFSTRPAPVGSDGTPIPAPV